jgi:hypothetical protein
MKNGGVLQKNKKIFEKKNNRPEKNKIFSENKLFLTK